VNISQSAANDWNPAIASAPDGAIYIAWDGYERGSYNLYLRAIREGQLGQTVQVTDSAMFNAHASLAVDRRNRVWIAWDESGPNWGKDWGVLGKPGTPLHASRDIRLVALENGRFLEPQQPLKQVVTAWLGGMNEYPQLAVAPNGVIQIFFRHYLHRLPTTDDIPSRVRRASAAPRRPGTRWSGRCGASMSRASTALNGCPLDPFRRATAGAGWIQP
jgi:hypothetical protein